jgi:hypothetical protein
VYPSGQAIFRKACETQAILMAKPEKPCAWGYFDDEPMSAKWLNLKD